MYLIYALCPSDGSGTSYPQHSEQGTALVNFYAVGSTGTQVNIVDNSIKPGMILVTFFSSHYLMK